MQVLVIVLVPPTGSLMQSKPEESPLGRLRSQDGNKAMHYVSSIPICQDAAWGTGFCLSWLRAQVELVPEFGKQR